MATLLDRITRLELKASPPMKPLMPLLVIWPGTDKAQVVAAAKAEYRRVHGFDPPERPPSLIVAFRDTALGTQHGET